jgi:hypothetical protein
MRALVLSLPRFSVAPDLCVKRWPGESTAVVRAASAGRTHLVGIEALAVLEAAGGSPSGLSLREIAHALDLDGDFDGEIEASLQRIIDGLSQSGLLHRVDDTTGLVKPESS